MRIIDMRRTEKDLTLGDLEQGDTFGFPDNHDPGLKKHSPKSPCLVIQQDSSYFSSEVEAGRPLNEGGVYFIALGSNTIHRYKEGTPVVRVDLEVRVHAPGDMPDDF